MGVLDELRYPTTLAAKLINVVLALVLFALLAAALIAGFVLYGIVSPKQAGIDLRVEDLLGHPSVVPFSVPGGTREGWFFPGLRGAPTIILCHGYQSNRAEVLTLVTALQEHRYNVFVFDFAGHGSSSGLTTLGYRETKELLAAIDAVAQRDDVDRARFGVWGANLGGYVALAAAATDTRIRAVAVDSVYDEPRQMLRVLVDRSGLSSIPLVGTFSRWIYMVMYFSYRNEPTLSARVASLANVPKLFIQAADNPVLAETTRELFLRAPEPRQQVVVQKGDYAAMMDAEKKAYENNVVDFFMESLPLVSAATR